jgi:SPP1 gp7 family putative phage head morphogenesis protein
MPIGLDAGDLVAAPDPTDTTRERAEIERANQPLVATAWTRWRTAEDERVCPECGPLDGLAWPADDGPQPPLHRNCRCTREFAYFEVGVRG